MKLVGNFNGTGAAVYLCVGQRVEDIKITALLASPITLDWNRSMRALLCCEGRKTVAAGTQTSLGKDAGVVPYMGGELLDSTLQTSTTYGEGVYLGWDRTDYSKNTTYGCTDIATDWTLGSASNYTGNFNVDTVSGSRIGLGSEIDIMAPTGKIYSARIMALTAGQGISANEVTLDAPVPTGKIMRISGKYALAPLALGTVTPEGVKLNITSDINVNDEMQSVVIDVGMQA